MITPRTLRCANGLLYFCMGVAVACCAAWGIGAGRITGGWQIAAMVVAAVVAVLWGGYYGALRWEVSDCGISRCLLGWRESYSWQQLEGATLSESSSNGVASCCITLSFPGVELRLSSDLLALDDVEGLRDDLRAAGFLPSKAEA